MPPAVRGRIRTGSTCRRRSSSASSSSCRRSLSFYFSLTRWTLFDAEFIGLDNFSQFLARAAAHERAAQHVHLCRRDERAQGRHRAAAGDAAHLAASGSATCCARSSSSRCSSAPSPSGITFAVLMQPSNGLINTALGAGRHRRPDVADRPQHRPALGRPRRRLEGRRHRAGDLHRGHPVDPRGVLRRRRARGRRLGEVPPRHPAAEPERDVHGHPAVVHRRAADVRPDLDDDPRRPGLHLGRAHLDDLQAVPGGLLRPVDRRQRRPVHPRHAHRLSDDAVLQPHGRSSCETRPVASRRGWLDAVALARRRRSCSSCRSSSWSLTAAKDRAEAALLEFTLADRVAAAARTSARSSAPATA